MEKSNITKNYIYNLIFQILSLIVPLITTPYVSRVLGADGIGKYSYALSVITYFNLFGCLGLTTYGQIEIAKHRDNLKKVRKLFNSVFVAKSFSMIIALGVYIMMLNFVQYNKDILLLMTIALISTTFDITWYFQGIEDFKKIVVRNSAVKIVGAAAIFLFIKDHEDLYKYILLLNIITLISNLSMWPYVKEIIGKWHFNISTLKAILKDSMIYFIPSIATTVYTVLDKSMIGWITGSYFQNGYYEQAHKIEQIVVAVLTSLSTVFLPRMTYLYNNGLNEELSEKLKNSINFILFASLPMTLGLISISSNLVPLFLGDGYLECIPLLQIFSFLIFAVGLNNALGMQFLMPSGRQNKFNIGVIAGAVINLVMNIILIILMGAKGAAISTVVSEFVILIIFMIYSKDYVSLRFYVKPIIKYGISSILMFLVIEIEKMYLPTSWISLLIEIMSGIVIYITFMFIINDDILYMILDKTRLLLSHKK